MKQKLSQAKSKGKSGVISLDRRKSFWVFLAAAVIGTLMRTYQLYATSACFPFTSKVIALLSVMMYPYGTAHIHFPSF